MSLTSEQLERRRRYIGSSDIGAILGLNPWRNARDVYLDKVFGKDPELVREGDSEAIQIGNDLEPPLVRWGAAEVGVELMDPLSQQSLKGHCGCQHDGLATDRSCGFEAKTAGILYVHQKGMDWGEPGTNQIPETYLLQATHQLYVADLEVIHVPALIGGRGRLLYRVDRNEELVKIVSETAEQFWQSYIAAQVEPPDRDPAHMSILKVLRRQPAKTVTIDFGLVENWRIFRGVRLAAEKDEEQAKRQIIDALGDAEAGQFEEGSLVTYFSQKGAAIIDRKKLQAKYSEIWLDVTTPNNYRVLREKKGAE